jgi:hypothetical protein
VGAISLNTAAFLGCFSCVDICIHMHIHSYMYYIHRIFIFAHAHIYHKRSEDLRKMYCFLIPPYSIRAIFVFVGGKEY